MAARDENGQENTLTIFVLIFYMEMEPGLEIFGRENVNRTSERYNAVGYMSITVRNDKLNHEHWPM